MLREVREELDRIEDFLMRGDQASADLAMILSALRGPDNDNEDIKSRTTSPLRTMIFPRLYQKAGNYRYSQHGEGHKTTRNLWSNFSTRWWGMRPASDFKLNLMSYIGDVGNHFLYHTHLAHEAVKREESTT